MQNSRRLTYAYDDGAAHASGSAYLPLAGRLKTAALVDSADTVEASANAWFLGNAATGKIEVVDPTATGGQRAFQYAWKPQQPALLQQSVEMQTGLARTIDYADPLWDSPTRVATGFTGAPAPDPLAVYDMTFDSLGRPATLQQSGSVFSGYGEPVHHRYAYNLRGQLTAARSYMGAANAQNATTRPMPGRQHTFGFDNAGNRTAASHDDSLPQAETVNAVGQVTEKENKSIHVSGVAAADGATVAASGAGVTTKRAGASSGRFWSIELSLNTATDAEAAKASVNINLSEPSPGGNNIQTTIAQTLFMHPKQETLAYDDDGNLLSDGQWTYAYDAENRLVSMQTKNALVPRLLALSGGERPLWLRFTYDYASRRVGKIVEEKIDGQWMERYHHRYVYNGSQLIAEIDAATGAVLRTFAWGATGELLMIHDRTDTANPQTYLPVRDASGSVTALVRAADSATVATYEYDPNGNLLRAQGEYAKKNPFTFGGLMDWETGLINGGSVYYASRLGRFINTAPSGDGDGTNGCFGVAPSVSYYLTRQYAAPSPRRNTVTPSWTSVDPTEYAAREAAWAAYEKAYATYEPIYEKWIYNEMEALNEARNQGDDDCPDDTYIAPNDANYYHFTGTHGSFDTGLSNNYLTGSVHFSNGTSYEYYNDGSWGMVNTLGSTLIFENDGSISLNFSSTQLSIMRVQNSAGDTGQNSLNTQTTRISTGSKLGDALRRVPLLGGILGGAGDILSGIGNIGLATITIGKYGSFSGGLGQILSGVGEIAGRVWSVPNTAVGLVYGTVGMLFGAKPQWDSHAAILRFENMRIMPSAMSLGSVNVFGPKSSPNSDNTLGVGVSTGREESLHTIQSRVVGPLYFPLHIMGGLVSMLSLDDREDFDSWHRHNFMEEGPMYGRVF